MISPGRLLRIFQDKGGSGERTKTIDEWPVHTVSQLRSELGGELPLIASVRSSEEWFALTAARLVSRDRERTPGAPSFSRSLRKGWVLGIAGAASGRRPLALRGKSQAREVRGIPPFAKSAKDGAPGLCKKRKGGPPAGWPRQSRRVPHLFARFANEWASLTTPVSKPLHRPIPRSCA